MLTKDEKQLALLKAEAHKKKGEERKRRTELDRIQAKQIADERARQEAIIKDKLFKLLKTTKTLKCTKRDSGYESFELDNDTSLHFKDYECTLCYGYIIAHVFEYIETPNIRSELKKAALNKIMELN